jgi:hypothetical protein
MARDPHAGHPDVTLSLTEERPDGGRVYQSWTICGCTLDGLRARLGPPEHESVATAEAVRSIGEKVRGQPGSVQIS